MAGAAGRQKLSFPHISLRDINGFIGRPLLVINGKDHLRFHKDQLIFKDLDILEWQEAF